MDYSLYFERVPKGKKPENEFQYPGPDDLPAWSDWLFHNLYVSFTGLIDHSDTKAGDIVNFLDYHFKRYNDDPAQFMLCIRTIKANIKKMIDRGPMGRDWLYQYELYTPIIDEWIKQKMTKVEPIPEKTKTNSEYTVKSVIIAYYYMFKKGIYPIPEIGIKGKMTQFYKALAEKYQLSYDSFRTDWKPLEKETNRLSQPENIRLAIELLKTFDYPKIKEVIELAKLEFKEAELKS